MSVKKDLVKYQLLFGTITVISLFLSESSNAALFAFWIFLIATIITILVDPELVKKRKKNASSDSNPTLIILIVIAIIFIIFIILSIPNLSFTEPSQKSSQFGEFSRYSEYYNIGVDNFNKGIDFLNNGATNLNKQDLTGAIAQYEISKDFFDKAKANFEAAIREQETSSNINKARYLMQSSDYYIKGVDEYTTGLRLVEKYKAGGFFENAIQVMLQPESLSTMSSELIEIKVKSEKAKNYFDLAKNAQESAQSIP